MHIDIVSDAICPWCYIGKRKLDQALSEIEGEVKVDIQWRPFQLSPSTPEQGVDRQKSLASKFGSAEKSQAIYETIREAGEADGISFAFDKIALTPNTLNAHRVINWALKTGEQHQLVEALFKAYFEQGLDIGDKNVLADAAAAIGMSREQVVELLEQETDKDLIKEEDRLAREMGISGVPCFIINGQYMLMGAQDPVRLARALKKLYAEEIATEKEGEAVVYPEYGSL